MLKAAKLSRITIYLALFILLTVAAQAQTHRNVIIFVADGLRHGSVTAEDMPTLYEVRTKGVNFENSYSVFPTFTTANASAIATGHRLGDTGDYSNGLYTGFRIFDTGNFDHGPGTTIPFIENDEIIADLDSHFRGDYLNEATLLETARQHGYNTAAIGKLGPTAIQDVSQINPVGQRYPVPQTIIVDDATAYDLTDRANPKPLSIPLPPALIERLNQLNLPLDAPARTNGFPAKSPYDNGYTGDATHPGTIMPNKVQQQWFADVATRAVLPMFGEMFEESNKPFAMLFWSRDPDATQHDHGDSLNQLVPGINGPSCKLALQNADHMLRQLLDWLDANPKVKANTDIFITSDHGFSTISRRELDRAGTVTKSESAQHLYNDAAGHLDTPKGFLPSGFLAIDLAWSMKTKLWDPDTPAASGSPSPYKEVHLAANANGQPAEQWERPRHGNGFLGNNVSKPDGSDALAIVAANGGTDLIYVPDKNAETVQRLVKLLLSYDYVSSIFVDDQYGKIPATLPLSLLDLVGTSSMPRPAIYVAFKSFYLTPGDVMRGVQISDTSLQEGQGNHGDFGRECTWNNMAAIGPDFKRGYIDKAPVGNADITPTLARILGFDLPSKGKLQGRVIEEAVTGKPDAPSPKTTTVLSDPDPDHNLRTVLFLQQYAGQKYFKSACMTSSKTVEDGICEKR
jgi:predicted AlkP superfamily pyrophosphatase or phosphodiesterase